MRKVITPSIRNSVYNALVNSNLSYAISVWGSGACRNKLKPLFIIQKRCIRNLFGIHKLSRFRKGHTKNVFNSNNILTIYNLYYYFTLSDIAKLRQLRIPEYLCALLNINVNKDRMTIPLLKTNHYQNSFMYQGPKLWNQVLGFMKDKRISTIPRINTYKSRAKVFLLKMQSYGSRNEWIDHNDSIDLYLIALKKDPYLS